MPRRSFVAVVLTTAAVVLTSASAGAAATPDAPSVPPSSPYEFLVQVGVLPVPGLAAWELARSARCATPEAALEAGDCAPAAGLGGGAPLRRTMW